MTSLDNVLLFNKDSNTDALYMDNVSLSLSNSILAWVIIKNVIKLTFIFDVKTI